MVGPLMAAIWHVWLTMKDIYKLIDFLRMCCELNDRNYVENKYGL